MSATRSKDKQPEPTVTEQIEELKYEIEAIMQTMQQCLAGIKARLDKLT